MSKHTTKSDPAAEAGKTTKTVAELEVGDIIDVYKDGSRYCRVSTVTPPEEREGGGWFVSAANLDPEDPGAMMEGVSAEATYVIATEEDAEELYYGDDARREAIVKALGQLNIDDIVTLVMPDDKGKALVGVVAVIEVDAEDAEDAAGIIREAVVGEHLDDTLHYAREARKATAKA